LTACNSTPDSKGKLKANSTKEQVESTSIQEVEQPIPISITKKEAQKRLDQFLKMNRRKFEENGELQEVNIGSGDYDGDQKDDFFFTALYFGGGDYLYPEYFYYDSKSDAIKHMTLKTKFEDIHNINVRSIDKTGLKGVSSVWAAFSGEHSYWRDVKTNFQINGNIITIDKVHDKALAKATKEVMEEMEAAQNELYGESVEEENSEEADY